MSKGRRCDICDAEINAVLGGNLFRPLVKAWECAGGLVWGLFRVRYDICHRCWGLLEEGVREKIRDGENSE